SFRLVTSAGIGDAELVALRVLHDRPGVELAHHRCALRDQPFDFSRSVGGDEIEMDGIAGVPRLGDFTEEQDRPGAVDGHTGVGLGRSAHAGEPFDLRLVVGPYLVSVQRLRPEPGHRRWPLAVKHDLPQYRHSTPLRLGSGARSATSRTAMAWSAARRGPGSLTSPSGPTTSRRTAFRSRRNASVPAGFIRMYAGVLLQVARGQ